jgi:hypothetical protein
MPEIKKRELINVLSNPETQLLARRYANFLNILILDLLKWKQPLVFLAAV